MTTRVLLWGMAALLACASPPAAGSAASPAAARLFIEAALLELDGAGLARARTSTLEQLSRESSGDVLSTLGGVAEHGVPLVFDPGALVQQRAAALDAAPALERFEVTPAPRRARSLALDMKLELSAAGTRHRFSRAERLTDARPLLWDTELETHPGERLVLLVQVTVIESDEDWRSVLERKRGGIAARP